MSNNAALLLARILISIIFISSGLQKFTDIGGTAGYISSVGLPAPALLAWVSAIVEVVAGIGVLIGFMTRYAAWLLALFCLVAAVFFHRDFADLNQMIHFMKNLAIAGGFLALSVAGPGKLSVDRRGA